MNRRAVALMLSLVAVAGLAAPALVSSADAAPVAAPAITSLSPNIGPVTGGQTITITGQGFSGAQRVLFQSVTAPALHVISDDTLTVHAPAHREGTFNVSVVTSHGTSPLPGSQNDYTFTVPVLDGVSPASGPTNGGNTLALEGDGLLSVDRVYFGSVVVKKFTRVNDHRITVQVPKHSAGTVHVRVAGGHGESNETLPDRYNYVGSLPTFRWNKDDTGSTRQSKIACATADLCVGATTAGGVFTYDHDTYSPATVGIPDVQIATCARSEAFCAVAGGTQLATYDGSSFSSPGTVDVGGAIVDVSCGGVGDCVVIGTHDAVELTDGVMGTTQVVDADSNLTSVSCPGPDFCLAVDDSGKTSTFNGSTWSSPATNPVRSGDGDGFVDCTSSDYCVQDAKNFGAPTAYRHGVWGSLDTPEGTVGTAGLSCATPALCVVVPNSEDFNLDLVFDGAKSAYTTLARPESYGDVSCPTTTACVATVDGILFVGKAT